MIWLRVPFEIFGLILQHLTLAEIGALDTAILNRVQRREYLLYLLGMDITLQISEENCVDEIVVWLLTRRVVTKVIHFHHFNLTTVTLMMNLRSKLTTLTIGSCKNIEDSDLDSFPDCPSLTSLSLISWRLSDSSLRQILTKYPHLTSFDISHSYLLTDETITFLSTALPLLTHLDLSNSKWFTDDSIGPLLSAQLPLVSLNLTGTSVFRDQAIQDLLSTASHRFHVLSISSELYSWDCRLAVLQKVAFPSLMSDVPSRQLLGLQGYFDFFYATPTSGQSPSCHSPCLLVLISEQRTQITFFSKMPCLLGL
jgi:hypothetical protein